MRIMKERAHKLAHENVPAETHASACGRFPSSGAKVLCSPTLERRLEMSKGRTLVIAVLGILVAMAAGGMFYYKWKFPYGYSHCCSVAMANALCMYAIDHAGRYPDGESSPEASLSLLHRSRYIPDPEILRGMIVPEAPVRRILESGGLLCPDTCGWHYVPGLSASDDGGIAILWCKVPLGHDGQRTKDGGREVVFVNSRIDWVPGEKWPAFLEEQKRLLGNVIRGRRNPKSGAATPVVDRQNLER